MLKQLIQVWRNNHGPILFVSGFVVAICMSVLWRFNLIPDIGPALRASPTLMGNRSKPATNIVVMTVTSDELPDAEVTIQFFSPPDMLSDTLTPLEIRTERLESGLKEFVKTDLPRGTFAAIAFVDLNENMQLDINDEGLPTEPFAFATSNRTKDASTLANGVFEVGLEPTFLKFKLKNPVAGEASQPAPQPASSNPSTNTSPTNTSPTSSKAAPRVIPQDGSGTRSATRDRTRT